MEVIFERPGLPTRSLPPGLRERLGGEFGFGSGPLLFANFVSTVDGVVSFGKQPSGSRISESSPADRFMMGVLRSFADAVLVGAGTMRGESRHLWIPQHVFPDAAEDFAALRRALGKPERPELYVTTASGELDPDSAALRAGAVVLAPGTAVDRIRELLPAASRIAVLGEDRVDVTDAVQHIRSEGHPMVLTEGGPRLMGQLVAAGLVDELFLTISHLIGGRDEEHRAGFVAGQELLPDLRVACELLSVRRAESFLFLRYRMGS